MTAVTGAMIAASSTLAKAGPDQLRQLRFELARCRCEHSEEVCRAHEVLHFDVCAFCGKPLTIEGLDKEE